MADHGFCRLLLSVTRKELNAAQRKRLVGAWSYVYRNFGAQATGEFHVPTDDFYWYGSCDCAYDARQQGISAWLNKFYPDHDTE